MPFLAPFCWHNKPVTTDRFLLFSLCFLFCLFCFYPRYWRTGCPSNDGSREKKQPFYRRRYWEKRSVAEKITLAGKKENRHTPARLDLLQK